MSAVHTPTAQVVSGNGMTGVFIRNDTAEGRALSRAVFGLSPAQKARWKLDRMVRQSTHDHPLFGGFFQNNPKYRVVPDEEKDAFEAEVKRMEAEEAAELQALIAARQADRRAAA